MTVTRRSAIHSLAAVSALLSSPWSPVLAAATRPRFRAIVDNDFAGDPDGLLALAHLLLSSSVAVPLVVGSHLHPGEIWDDRFQQAKGAATKARELLAVMNLEGRVSVVVGAEAAIPRREAWKPSPATAAIVAEAMRADSKLPLFYAAGAGPTELALAWLAEPRIGRRLRLVWIGGGEHPGLADPPPGRSEAEYNLTIDLLAAQIVFNESNIEIWQVPRDAYRQMLFSAAELRSLSRCGALGRYLGTQVDRVIGKEGEGKFGDLGEACWATARSNLQSTAS